MSMRVEKKQNMIWKTLFLGILVFVLMCTGSESVYAASDGGEGSSADSGDETVTLRVAFPMLEGLSEFDGNGNPTGLVVDYLNEISKYTNWNYEYIPVDPELMIDKFIAGEFDLMGGTFYDESFEGLFAYPEYSMGSNRAVLLARREDDTVKGSDLRTLNGKTIGVFEKAAEKIRRLQEYLRFNDLDCELKYYTKEDMIEGNLYHRLENKEVDLLLGNDKEDAEQFRAVTSFEAQPYYIVTNPGRQDILDGLNMALGKILESDPDFAEEHYNANMSGQAQRDIVFNSEELEYIEHAETIKVAVVKGWHPLYCAPDVREHHNGIIADFLQEVTRVSGLKFTYIYAGSYSEAIQLLQEGKADMLGGFLDSDTAALEYGLALTKPYISLNCIVVKNKYVSYPDSGLTGAVVNGRTMPDSVNAGEVRYYDSITDGLEAVNSGEADFFYGLSAAIEEDLQREHYPNVTSIATVNKSTDISVALLRPVETELLTIFNKVIGNMSKQTRNAILDRNLVSMGSSSVSLSELMYANPLAFIAAVSVFVLFIAGVLLIIGRAKVKNALMETELRRAEAENHAKGEFLSRMSHEIRTPMNAIMGLSDLACMAENVPPELERELVKIRESSRYLLTLINDILDMSRIENGMMELTPERFFMDREMEEVCSMMEVQAVKTRIQFHSDIQVQHNCLCGDAIRLRQVLINLLSNAFKFTKEEGEVFLQVKEMSYDGKEAEVYFAVRDTGIGIDKDSQTMIFGAFEQVGSNISKSEGTGLGLPISRTLVQLMGGELCVKSESGQGAEFYFTAAFPVCEEDKEEPEAEQEILLTGIRILLAEDNDLNAEIAMELLAIKGVAVERAANGRQAVEMYQANPPGYYSVVLMDLQMPEMNGLMAAAKIRSCGREDSESLPIIAMTANTFQEDVDGAKEAGMNEFIPKPVDPGFMYRIIGEQLN
ncbi:ATP-binding protein [Lachnotalea sp. AF33-28]|uniref:ATP-binding protein n=1 Tax=Lachnotalea sp. AF33-28 TaxID=2292046 RepID=UPI000E4EAB2E|nr:transporter substrate-binding domain-containing protein [Lachnotalea sp. AF33-28]RHP29088.1 response regulator [Lachnotalea sp. AF33-28]